MSCVTRYQPGGRHVFLTHFWCQLLISRNKNTRQVLSLFHDFSFKKMSSIAFQGIVLLRVHLKRVVWCVDGMGRTISSSGQFVSNNASKQRTKKVQKNSNRFENEPNFLVLQLYNNNNNNFSSAFVWTSKNLYENKRERTYKKVGR